MLYNHITLERHDFSAAHTERLQNAKLWVLRLNADGPPKPLRQRPEFVGALKQCLIMQDAHLAETEQTVIPIHPQHQQSQRQNQQFEGGENFDHKVDRETGWRYYRATGKAAGSIFIFIFNFAAADFTMADELELVATHII